MPSALTHGAQQPLILSKHAASIKAKIDSLHPGDQITVLIRHGPRIYATFTSESPNSFQCRGVDAAIIRNLTFEEVKNVKIGYGGYNSVQQRHTDHERNALIAGLAFTGLIVLVLVAASSH